MKSEKVIRTGKGLLRRVARGTKQDKGGQPYHDIIKTLENSFSQTFDSENTYKSFEMETLLDCTDLTNEVRVLVTPNKFLLQSPRVFDGVKRMVEGCSLVFPFDPSNSLRVARKLFHLDQVADLRHSGNLVEGQTFKEQLQVVHPSELDQGFYRNIFNLKFAEESEIDLDMLREVLHSKLQPIEQLHFSDEKQKEEVMLRKAQAVIWGTLVSERDYNFVNQNVKLLFEFGLLRGFGAGRLTRLCHFGWNARAAVQGEVLTKSHHSLHFVGLLLAKQTGRGAEVFGRKSAGEFQRVLRAQRVTHAPRCAAARQSPLQLAFIPLRLYFSVAPRIVIFERESSSGGRPGDGFPFEEVA